MFKRAALALLMLPSLAFAWGGEGHQIVALIAEKHLTPEAVAATHELLGDDADISDAEVVNWADVVRRERQDTAPWHYVNIPITAAGYDALRDGPVNVITAIEAQAAILADVSKPKALRVDALKFVIHFVGDLHQPLHSGDRNDKGGNTALVFLPNSAGQKATNLHAVWDGAMLRQWLKGTRVASYADALNGAIKPEDEQLMMAGTPIEWANEAHDVARDSVYPGVDAGKVTRLDVKYVEAARPVTDKQLTRGGMRLAAVLNRAFVGATTRSAP